MVSQFCDFKYGFPHCILVYRVRGPPELDAAALAASVMGMVRSQTSKTGFFHEVSLQGKSGRDFMAKLEADKVLGTMMRSIACRTACLSLSPRTFCTRRVYIRGF